jgi:hypothetical protein
VQFDALKYLFKEANADGDPAADGIDFLKTVGRCNKSAPGGLLTRRRI